MGKIEEKLKELNITIPTPPSPKGMTLKTIILHAIK